MAIFVVSLVLAGWVYDTGLRFAGFDRSASEQELGGLRGKLTEMSLELSRLRSVVDASESNLQIERTAQQQLTRQVRSLEEENARLKEDLAVFENLALSEAKESSVNISQLQVVPDTTSGQFRYRMLVARQGGNKGREFNGSFQLAITLHQDGKSANIIIPETGATDLQKYLFTVKHFRHLGGLFKVPVGSRVKSVEVRILQDGILKESKRIEL